MDSQRLRIFAGALHQGCPSTSPSHPAWRQVLSNAPDERESLPQSLHGLGMGDRCPQQLATDSGYCLRFSGAFVGVESSSRDPPGAQRGLGLALCPSRSPVMLPDPRPSTPSLGWMCCPYPVSGLVPDTACPPCSGAVPDAQQGFCHHKCLSLAFCSPACHTSSVPLLPFLWCLWIHLPNKAMLALTRRLGLCAGGWDLLGMGSELRSHPVL